VVYQCKNTPWEGLGMSESWRDKILEQFVPNISKLSIVSDPDNLLTEEKMAVTLRNRGFDILEFNDAIEFRYAYESKYRSIWDEGNKTELVVIIHTQKADLNYLPYDLLEKGKKFYFNIAEIFPMFSPYILGFLDKSLFDTLYLFREKYPKSKQGDKFTIDFLLRYVYKIDINTINDELDLIKSLLHIHYNNLEIPALYIQRIVGLINEKKIFTSLQIDTLLNNKDYFIDYLMEKHKEIVVDSPEVQVLQVLNKKTKKIDILFKHIESENIENYSNHKEWINLSWKFANIISFVYQNSNTNYIEQLESVYAKINDFYEKWLTSHYSALITIPSISPTMVHHIPHYLAYQYRQNKTRIALIIIDGLALNQWITLRDSLEIKNIQFIEKALFAWIPTLTSVSRQSIFSGKSPYEFESSIDTTEKEEKFWSLFWENNNLEKQSIIYLKGVDTNEKIKEVEDKLTQSKTVIAGLVVNKIDNIMHGMQMGMEGFHNQIKLYGKNDLINKLLSELIKNNYEVWITSDHGNTECIGRGQPHEASIAKSRGERVRIYKSKDLLESIKNKYPWSEYWNSSSLPKNYLPLIAKGNSAFLPESNYAISHGSISMQETIVPFIKVIRK
jgi:hypothetical protein